MHEDLEISSDTAEMMRKLTIQYREIVEQALNRDTEKLNDELSLVMIASYNGLANILIHLFEAEQLIAERKAICGKYGYSKKIQGVINPEEEDEPEEVWEDVEDDDEE